MYNIISPAPQNIWIPKYVSLQEFLKIGYGLREVSLNFDTVKQM